MADKVRPVTNWVVLVMGLPGSGKSTLARPLAELLGGLHLENDRVRTIAEPEAGWSKGARLKHARRVGRWARMLSEDLNCPVVVDMVCPTPEMRQAIAADFVVFLNTISEGRFDDTNAMFRPPSAGPDDRVHFIALTWDDPARRACQVAGSIFFHARALHD